MEAPVVHVLEAGREASFSLPLVKISNPVAANLSLAIAALRNFCVSKQALEQRIDKERGKLFHYVLRSTLLDIFYSSI